MISIKRITQATALSCMTLLASNAVPGSASLSHAADRASHADIAWILAGMKPAKGSASEKLTRSGSWRRHARNFDDAWKSVNHRKLSKIRAWSKTHLTNPQKTLLYMFSGPDFMYADTFFPDASTYVLAGLEPVGDEPDVANMSSGRLARGLLHIRASLRTILRLSFFMTKEMRVKLGSGGFRGTVPLLYVFMARAGKTVEDIEFYKIRPDGTLNEIDSGTRASGVKITFSATGVERKKTLYYFSTNISNSGLKKSGFLKFLERLGPSDGFVKSASYLMHRSGFSDIRDFVLRQSETIVEDDSGIPLRYFDKARWNLKPFGSYTRPISLFANRYQPGMRKLFRSKSRKKIDFGIGYRHRPGQTTVLLAEKKKAN